MALKSHNFLESTTTQSVGSAILRLPYAPIEHPRVQMYARQYASTCERRVIQ